LPGASVRAGVTAVDLLTDDHDRVAGLHLRERDGRERTVCPVVVGADGVRSRIARVVTPQVLTRPSAAAH
jgi:2-polyprenyl-6-methoxyphenol hydroxylase-like FAD-dependent oxidoreductase